MAPLKPSRLKEVVYTLSPFEQSVMSGVWKHGPANVINLIRTKGFNVTVFFLFPVFGTMWYDRLASEQVINKMVYYQMQQSGKLSD